MRKRIRIMAAGILGAMLASALLFQAAAEEAGKETETEAEGIVIGQKESDEDYQVQLVNESGKEITKIELRASYEEYSDNLLPEKVSLRDGEQGTLWCKPAEILNYVPPVYDIRLTFADEETAVLHTLPFGDAEELKVRTDEGSGVVYVDFFSISMGSETDSLQSEKNIAQTGEDAMITDYRVRTGQEAPAESSGSDSAGSDSQGGGQAQSAPAPAPAPSQQVCLDDGLMF